MSENSKSLTKERLNKFLARCGIASRRESDVLIEQGRVSVNNVPVEHPVCFVNGKDIVKVDGERIGVPDKVRMWRYNKLVGQITTHNDPERRQTVFKAVASQDPTLPRLVSVGRLDINSEGLLLLTNAGNLSHALEIPSNKWTRRYRIRAYGNTPKNFAEKAAQGVSMKGVTYGSIQAKEESRQGANAWYVVTLQEGKNREIRKIFEYFGLQVNRLIRTAYGPFQLGGLLKGSIEEVPNRVLKEQLGKIYDSL